MKGSRNKTVLSGILLLWLTAIAGGLKILGDYANSPGAVGRSPSAWPAQTHLALKHDGLPTLVLFLHPKCSCSDASVGELDTLMARVAGKAHVYAIFVQPKGWLATEARGRLWNQASAIPGVTPLLDPEGREARRFGALTSGHLFAFDDRGRLAFSGGITGSRGHRGDNSGLQTAVQFVNSGTAPLKQTRVFGCSLFNAHEKVAIR